MKTCCVCGTSEDLSIAPLMTGDKFGQEPQYPVCGFCVRAWYESGQTTVEGILIYRGLRQPRPQRVATL